LTGDNWVEIEAPDEGDRLLHVAVGTDTVWCVACSGKVYSFHLLKWKTVQEKHALFCLFIFVLQYSEEVNGSCGLILMHSVFQVWFRKGIKSSEASNDTTFAIGGGWVRMTQNMRMLAVGSRDQVLCIVYQLLHVPL